ncbi:hypothetical protein A2U01_0107062, partial [Trifolium medium]|nr:hypothetical protein [Trifolium medium]
MNFLSDSWANMAQTEKIVDSVEEEQVQAETIRGSKGFK